jgi:hypothetical protein
MKQPETGHPYYHYELKPQPQVSHTTDLGIFQLKVIRRVGAFFHALSLTSDLGCVFGDVNESSGVDTVAVVFELYEAKVALLLAMIRFTWDE